VIRDVFLLISRKNGKTTLAAATMLVDMIVGGE
jgi:phage terminase large subunit-like protein